MKWRETRQLLPCPLCNTEFERKETRGPKRTYCYECCPFGDHQAALRIQIYGLSHPSFCKIWAEQDGKCAICKAQLFRAAKNGYCIDHDHENNIVRGILCYSCNVLIVGLEQPQSWQNAAKAYLCKPR
jgi:hypothetical protein